MTIEANETTEIFSRLHPDDIRLLAAELARAIAIEKSKPEPLVDVKELCANINASVDTIYKWVGRTNDKIPHHRIGAKLLFRLSEVHAWLKSRERKSKFLPQTALPLHLNARRFRSRRSTYVEVSP